MRAQYGHNELRKNAARLSSAILVAIGVFMLAGCAEKGDSESTDSDATRQSRDAKEDDKETRPIPVEVSSTHRGEIFAAFSGTAALEAFEEAQVVAKVEGQVKSILVEEGDIVKAGQVLARLDGDRLRLRLEESRANLAKAERDYKRNVDLHNKGLVASGAFENIKYDMDALRAAFNIAKLEYDYSTIRAPISGVIANRMIKVGNTISVNAPCFHIADLQPLVAYLHVPEREFGKISAGQPVYARIDALKEQRFRGVVARISPVVDSATGTFKTTIEMDPLDNALKPGMFARMSIIYDTRPDALLVPRAALTETEIGTTVYVVTGDTVEKRNISTGFSWRDQLEVTNGLTDGESVVVVGQSGLKDGARVQVIGAEPVKPSGVATTPPDEASAVSNQNAG